MMRALKLQQVLRDSTKTGIVTRFSSRQSVAKLSEASKVPIREIQFNVSVGRIAAKWWGPTDCRPILCLHGWQDNAGSFDTLIPLLPHNLAFLAIDLPGHGFSANYASGYYYHVSDLHNLLEEIRRIFNWRDLSLLGHSMGALAPFTYAVAFPSTIDSVCSLDMLKPLAFETTFGAEFIRTGWTKSFAAFQSRFDTNKRAPEYTYDELAERVHRGSFNSINRERAKFIIQRGVERSSTDPKKFYFSRDIRWKYFHHMLLDHNISLEMIKHIRAPYLFVRGDDKVFNEPIKNIADAVDAFRRYTPDFQMIKVDGTHHLHLNTPELISDHVGDFFLEKHQREAASMEQTEILRQ